MLQLVEAGRLTRFLFQKNRFSREKGTVKANAFMPPPNLMVSVYCTHDFDENAVWDAGNKVLQSMRAKVPEITRLYARADFDAAGAIRNSLLVERNDDPLPGHANLKGWPNDKGKQLEIALRLASECSLVMNE